MKQEGAILLLFGQNLRMHGTTYKNGEYKNAYMPIRKCSKWTHSNFFVIF
jgi:hypothetical protein